MVALIMVAVALAIPHRRSVVAAGQKITATTATEDMLVLGQPIPVTISVTSDTLVTGEVSVNGETGINASYPLEVPAGSAKEITVIAPPIRWIGEGYVFSFVAENGETLATTRLRTRFRFGDTVVGVFPSIGTDPPKKVSLPTDTEAYLFSVPDDQLTKGPAAFSQYDVLIGTERDIEGLDDNQLTALTSWISRGGRLVLDDGDPTTVTATLDLADSLDSAADNNAASTSAASMNVGDGSVFFSEGKAQAGNWEAVSAAAGARSWEMLGPIAWNGSAPTQVELPQQGLTKYSGNPLVGGLTLAIATLLYAIVIGPGLYLIVRRRRSRLWVIGPALAIILCAVIWVDSERRHRTIHNAHGTLITVKPHSSEVSTIEMEYQRTSRPATITAPAEFLLRPAVEFSGVSNFVVEPSPNATRLSNNASAGSFALFGLHGAASEFDDQLGGSAELGEDPNEISGEITNHLDVDLHQVGVFWNGRGANLGELPAGETISFSFDKSDRRTYYAVESTWPEAYAGWLWEGDLTPGARDVHHPREDLVTPAVLDLGISNQQGLLDGPNVSVVGWTDELPSPATGTKEGATAVLTEFAPDADDEAEGRSAFIYADENVAFFGASALIRLDAPDTSGDLTLSLPRSYQNPRLLIDGEWFWFDPPKDDSVLIPRELMDESNGVYLRAEINMESEFPDVGPPALRAADPDLDPDIDPVPLDEVKTDPKDSAEPDEGGLR